jgi:type II secretory pathway component PulM
MKRLLQCFLCACALHTAVSAHVLDQYLQVTQIALAPDGVRIELRLIPGVQVADRICTLIDANGDGEISAAEEQAYARRVSQEIELAISGVNAPLTLTDLQFPTQSDMREGLGTIHLTYEASVNLRAAAQQQLYFRNNHLSELGVYLVNALMPTTNEIKIGAQMRDPLQREMRFDYHLPAANSTLWWRGIAIFLGCLLLLFWNPLRHFFRRLQADGKFSHNQP